MSRPNDGGYAFPQALGIDNAFNGCEGMSLRDYFAAQALAGMLASPPVIDRSSPNVNHPGWAENAYKFADAMLAERDK